MRQRSRGVFRAGRGTIVRIAAAAMIGEATARCRPSRANSRAAGSRRSGPLEGSGARDSGYGIAVRRAASIRAGEIVGVTGVRNGRRELLRALPAGYSHFAAGGSRRSGAFTGGPDDRGLIPSLTLTRTWSSRRGGRPWIRRGRVDWVARARLRSCARLRRGRPEGQTLRCLAQRNQQKVVVGRSWPSSRVWSWRRTRPRTRPACRGRSTKLAGGGGSAVLVYSSDLDEVLALADQSSWPLAGRWSKCRPARRGRRSVS
jgi:hypothetical protein